MKVTATDIEAQLGTKGLTFYISDNQGNHKGKLRVGQATVEWCKGRTRMGNGKKIPMETFLDALEEI